MNWWGRIKTRLHAHWGVFGHRWVMCRCLDCGAVRDREHDWINEKCQVRCRNCGLHGSPDHRWSGCTCEECHETNHFWDHGVCRGCGMRCPHERIQNGWESAENFWTPRGRKVRLCELCGEQIDPVQEQPPKGDVRS